MHKQLLTLPIMVAAILFPANTLAQATFETLMTHSVSTAIGTHAGTALGNATNALANSVANQTSASTRTHAGQSVPASRRTAAKRTQGQAMLAPAASPAPSNNGSLIASIQGGARVQPRPGCPTDATVGAAKAGDATVANQNCGVAASANDHPSVVNLPAPQ